MSVKKGLAISSVTQMVLIVLVGGVVSVAIGGPIMGQIEEGFGVLGEITGSGGGGLNISDKATLSQATLYVYQRASNDGCTDPSQVDYDYASPTVPEQIAGDLSPPEGINANGYPALEDTYLTSTPPCTATDDETGRDMEGSYSRVNFVIDETRSGPIVLGQGNTWIDERVRGSKKNAFMEETVSSCGTGVIESAVEGAGTGAVLGAVGSGGNPAITAGGTALGFAAGSISGMTDARFLGSGNKFIVFFKSDVDDSRSDSWLSEASSQDFTDGRTYCFGVVERGITLNPMDWAGGQLHKSPFEGVYNDDFGGNVAIKLCPGDRGYIQMNKQNPQNTEEAGEEWGSAHNYPFIEITHSTQQSC